MQKEMQHKITRIVYELNALDKGPFRLDEMAAELGVSLRTLQRDMADIQEADFPLYCPTPGEYAFVKGFSLKKMKLSDGEASLLVVLHELASSLGENFDLSYALLKKRLLSEIEESPFFVKFAIGEEFPDTPLTQALTQSVRLHEEITLCYQDGRRKCYPVRPLKVLWMDGFWYLLALTNTDKLLKFRLEKITEVQPLGKFFTHTPDIEALIRQGTNIWFDKKRPLHVTLEISPQAAKYFQKRSYFPLQKLEKKLPNGSLLISCQASNTEEIIHTILHWLPEIKVKEPADLAQEVRRRVEQYLREL